MNCARAVSTSPVSTPGTRVLRSKMQMNKTDQNDAEGLAQIMRTGWYRPVHVKSLDAHRARALLGARAQLVGMTTRLSNMIRGVLKTFGLLPGAGRGLRFDRKVASCGPRCRCWTATSSGRAIGWSTTANGTGPGCGLARR